MGLFRMIWESPWFWLMRLFYLWPLLLLGKVHMLGWHRGVELYVVLPGSWYARAWRGWAGFAGPEFIMVSDPVADNTVLMRQTLKHEFEHIQQWRRWGLAFPLAYGLCLVWYGYKNNPFEVAARAAELRER